MHQSTTFTKLLRVLQFRKHIKELTTACKRINKDGCYEFVTSKSKENKSVLRSKQGRKKSSYHLSTSPTLTVDNHIQPFDHLSCATSTSPVNLSMIILQSYKPLHAKSMQFNKNTIAVIKGTVIKALYTRSNWVFIEIPETGQTGFIPIYCLRLSESLSQSTCESSAQNNISLLNVSIHDKPNYSRQSISNHRMSTPPSPGRFISSIGPCHMNNESKISTKTQTFTRRQAKEESILSQQISNMSLDDDDNQDTYGTLNLTPHKNRSFNILNNQSIIVRPKNRLRVIENYQRQFIGDISVLESEVVIPVNTSETNNDWQLVKRGDGKQGYIPKHIVILDQNFA